MSRRRSGRQPTVGDKDVFVNCPFDPDYRPIFDAIVYTVVRCGYRVRSALEADNSADSRFEKICSIIAECPFGIHDISRTDLYGDPPLPRFDMPFELGLFLGARRFGARVQKTKACLILDSEKDRFRRFLSDISGQDIRTHDNDVNTLIRELSAWFRRQTGGLHPGGGQAIADEYQIFRMRLPEICARNRIDEAELEFGDFNNLVTTYVAALATSSSS